MKSEVRFIGSRDKRGRPMVAVWQGRLAKPLADYDELNALSPSYQWGRRGPGADQLALDMIRVAFGEEECADDLVEVFAVDVVASLPPTWVLTADEVRAWIGDLVAGCLALNPVFVEDN